MKTYNVKFVSQAHSLALILVWLVIYFGAARTFILLQNHVASIFLHIVLLILAYLSWQKFVTGRTAWTIDDSGINMKWIKPFAFSESKDLKLSWKEIENISQGLDPKYDTIKIRLTSGEKLKFYHDNLTTKDDYEEFKKLLYENFYKKKQLKTVNNLNSNTSQR